MTYYHLSNMSIDWIKRQKKAPRYANIATMIYYSYEDNRAFAMTIDWSKRPWKEYREELTKQEIFELLAIRRQYIAKKTRRDERTLTLHQLRFSERIFAASSNKFITTKKSI